MDILNFDERLISGYVESIRPPLELRKKLDVGYSYSENEIVLFEIRPDWKDENLFHQYPFVKAKFIKSGKIWKIYCFRTNGKWELYQPNPEVRNIASFIEAIEEDEHGCFRG